ncbi:MAG: hypothetical protein KJO54_13230 [Gammaproteobacteria bacterium]|nr:hypothetical protein [Gammaproteobacteria bacterium]NNF60619.1 hypothetical protein [Gammaproteobacteria bacterium]
MSTRSAIRIAISTLTIALVGCASTIGNVVDLEQTTFRVGATHKSEVANVLGFPANRETDDSLEYWGYRQKPELTGLVYALPTGSNTVTTYTATKTSGPTMMDSVAVIYTFDADGILTSVFESDQD